MEEGNGVVTEKGKESVGVVKFDLRFCEGYIYCLIVETVNLIIIFGNKHVDHRESKYREAMLKNKRSQ